MMWMPRDYCRWTNIRLSDFCTLPLPRCFSLYENLIRANCFAFFDEFMVECSQKEFYLRFELWRFYGIGFFFLGIWLRCIIRLLGIRKITVSCISGDTVTQKEWTFFSKKKKKNPIIFGSFFSHFCDSQVCCFPWIGFSFQQIVKVFVWFTSVKLFEGDY